MNKKSAIIILVVCIVFIGGVAAIALTSQGSWGGWFFFGGERVEVDEGSDLNLEGVTEVTVSLPFGETIVEAGEPGVTLKGHFTTSSKKDQYPTSKRTAAGSWSNSIRATCLSYMRATYI